MIAGCTVLPSEIIPTRTNKFMSKLSDVVNSC